MNKRKPNADIMLEVRLNCAETDHASQEAYDAVYSEVELWQSNSFYAWMFDQLQLQLQPRDVYLDVSCGRGELVQRAQQQGIQGFGLDLSHQALKLGYHRLSVQGLVTGNAQILPYAANTFDVVSNIGSLEHYVDMRQAVREMHRVLKPGGRAIVLVPNTFSLMQNIWIAFRQGKTAIDPYQPIQRYAARREWQQLLEESGLVVVETKKYNQVRPQTWSDLLTMVRRPKELVRTLLAPFVPLNLSFCFVFTCVKSDENE